MSDNNRHINNSIHNFFVDGGITRSNNIIHGSNGQWGREHQVPKIHVPVNIIEWHHVVYAEEEVTGTSDPLAVLIL